MAKKKSAIDQAAFMEEYSAQAKLTVSDMPTPITNILNSSAIDSNGLEFIDIELMDDAPPDWNDYARLKDEQPEKYIEVKLSIYEYGVLQSLLLMRKADGRYMILAGHNRRDICKEIIFESKDTPNFDINKYKFVPCTVRDEMDKKTAINLIDDTNYSQRDYALLSKEQKARTTTRRMQVLKEKRYSRGESIEQLARDLNVKKSTIYDNLAIANKVIKPIQELYFKGILAHNAVLKYAHFSRATQEWIFDNYGDQINTEISKRLKKNMTDEQIKDIFETNREKMKRITFLIPEDRTEEIREMVKQALKSK